MSDPYAPPPDAEGAAPLRVLHGRSSATMYGPERSLLLLVPPLAARGVQTQLLAVYRRAPDAPEIHPWIQAARDAGLDAGQVIDPGPFSLGVVRRVARRIGASGADVLHTHDYKTNILGGLAARRPDRSLPWVATVHLHTDTTRRLRVYRTLDLFLLRLADRVVTVSRDQCHMLLRRGVDRRRIALIPTVIDSGAFAARMGDAAASRSALGLPGDAAVITLIGRLTPQKGVEDLLDAARLVCDARPEARFLIAGHGPLREDLEARAAGLGLNGAVRFLGYCADIPPLLAASDIVVLPSRAEGLPLVLLEALAAGRPVVASRVGGIPDVVRDNETGLLVPPNAPDRVADGLLDLLAHPDRAQAMGLAGRSLVRRQFSPEHAARRLAAIYRTVLAERLA
ncbi:hypothetical protein DCC79_16495 [bacterium]|nr:MAG: hypothetical protein DCC79_16495 [bacterium]